MSQGVQGIADACTKCDLLQFTRIAFHSLQYSSRDLKMHLLAVNIIESQDSFSDHP